MFTMQAPSCINGANSADREKAAPRLTFNTAAKSASVMLIRRESRVMPALLTSPSNGSPVASTASRTMRGPSSDVRSTWTAVMCSEMASSAARSTPTTVNGPLAANFSEMALPIPPAAPVTTMAPFMAALFRYGRGRS